MKKQILLINPKIQFYIKNKIAKIYIILIEQVPQKLIILIKVSKTLARTRIAMMLEVVTHPLKLVKYLNKLMFMIM
jgi:hypothetical protein